MLTPKQKREFVKAMFTSMSKPDFYGSAITLQYVEEEAERIINGERPQGGPGMFIQGWLQKAKVI